MENNRKPDQYYNDLYDRSTISSFKRLELQLQNTAKKFDESHKNVNQEDKQYATRLLHDMTILFYKGDHWKRKEQVINEWIRKDEEKDSLIENTLQPSNVKCKTCEKPMVVIEHFFRDNDRTLLFLYDCPDKHAPRRVLFADGTTYVFPKRTCEKCGYSLQSESKKEKDRLVTIETCTGCGNSITDIIELAGPKEEVINEEDRKKYCVSDEEGKHITRSIDDIMNLRDILEKQDDQKMNTEMYGLDKIEKPTIPKLEKKLAKQITTLGFTKFQLDKPEIGRYAIVPFSVQDPSDRMEEESVRLLKKGISDFLLTSNWRLMTTGISYRLGVLEGRLRAYENDEDLIKIGKEIIKKGS